MPAKQPPDRADLPTFPCDALNVQLMRLRLRPQGTEARLDEEKALINLVRNSGMVRAPSGVRVPEEVREGNLADAVMLDLMIAWQGGRLLYFSRKGLDRVVRDYLRQCYWDVEAAGEDEEGQDFVDGGATDPGEEIQLAQLDMTEFRQSLAPSPRKLFDWIVEHGEDYSQHGWQTRAKDDLEVSDSWVSVNHSKLLEHGQRFFEVR